MIGEREVALPKLFQGGKTSEVRPSRRSGTGWERRLGRSAASGRRPWSRVSLVRIILLVSYELADLHACREPSLCGTILERTVASGGCTARSRGLVTELRLSSACRAH